MSNADLTAVIDAETKDLIEKLKKASEQMKSFEQGTGQSLKNIDKAFQDTFKNVEGAVSNVKMALGTAAPIAIFNFLHSEMQKGIEEFKKIGDEADKAMISTDFFQVLAYSAKESNTSFDKVKDGLKTFAEQLGKLKNDEGDLKDKFDKTNGALLEQLRGASTVEKGVRLMADAIAKVKDPYAQAKLAADAFGKGNGDLARILNDGAAGLDRTSAAARSYGLVVDENLIRRSQVIKSDFESVSNVIETKFRMALLNISPIIKAVGDQTYWLSEMIRKAWEAIAAGSAGGFSDSGLNDQVKIHSENLAKLKEQLDHLQSGGAVGGGIWNDIFGGEDAAKEIEKTNKAIAEETALLKTLTDEQDKRKSQSRTAPLDIPKPEKEDDSAKKLLDGQRAMDELMKKYYTDTHQYYQAIEMDAQKERDRFKLLLEEKKIDAAQYSIAMVLIAKDEATKIAEAYDHTREHIRSAMSGLSSEFEKILGEWQNGQKITLQSIEKDFVMMIERMVLKAAVLEPLFGTGKAGPGEFGAVGGGLNSLLGGAGGGVSLSGIVGGLSKIFAFHEGGVVGECGTARMISPGVFQGAVRYHQGGIAGLMPGEVPAILQQGETVIPRGGAAGGHVFNVNIQTPDPGAFRDSQGQIAAMLSQAVSRGQRNL